MLEEQDDAVLLTMKGPDTAGALLRLKAAGVSRQPIFCFQNGVANEPAALRFFENVYGATVILPADYDTPGSESKATSDITEQRFAGYSGQEIFVVAKDPAGFGGRAPFC